MSLEVDLTGRVALVTGGTRGIGLAIVQELADAGASVIATGTSEQIGSGLAALRQEGLKVHYHQARLDEEPSLRSFLDFVSSMERLDILVNNAGVNEITPVDQVDPSAYDRLHRVNLRAPLLLCGAAVPVMRRGGWGRIVNIASIWATITKPGRSMYTSSKFGLVGMTKTVAVENAALGILVNAVSPGFTLTELTRSTLSADEIDRLATQVPAGRFAEPKEMATVVAFLCSPLNTYLTAQNVTVDGGFTTV